MTGQLTAPTWQDDPDRAFRALTLNVRRRLDGLLQGEQAGLRLGPGSESEEVTRYRPGEDDVRRIDWNVTARHQEPHVWRSRAEHELDGWLLLDQTPSMAFGTVRIDKAELAAMVAGTVGLLTDGPGNRLGIARLAGDGVRFDAPLPGRVAARRVLRADGARAAAVPATDLAAAMSELDRRQRRPGLRVVVSDFVEADGSTARPLSWEPALRRLATRHDVVVVEVLDPRELTLPDVGHLLLTDPETGRQREIWTGDKRLRQRYDAAAAVHRQSVADGVRAAGAAHIVLRTDHDWVRELARFIRRRRHTPSAHSRRIR